METAFETALRSRVDEVLERCVACGACVDVCPMPGPAGIDTTDSAGIAAGVLSILRGEAQPEASARWAAVCSGSGHCISGLPVRREPAFHAGDGAARQADAARSPPRGARTAWSVSPA